MRLVINVYHHGDRLILDHITTIIQEVRHMAVDLTRIKKEIGELQADSKAIRAAIEKGVKALDAIKAKLDALAGGNDAPTQAELEALSSQVDAVSTELQAGSQEISDAADRDNIDTVALPDGKVGEAYVATIDVPDPAAITGIIQSGALPDGLTLVLEEITGTPTVAGDSSFVLWHIDDQSRHVGPATNYTISVKQ